jgi:hypothetical protein
MLDEWNENRREIIGKLSMFVDKDSMEKLVWLSNLESNLEQKWELRNDVDAILGVYEPWLWQSERPVIVAPSQDKVDGDIEIGVVSQGDYPVCVYRIPKNFFVRHLALYGQTGHSKTTVFYTIQDQFIRALISILSFDPKKDGRALLRRFEELIVLPWNHFPWNPLRPPPGMPITIWWANLSQICGYSFGWFVASSNYLQSHLDLLHDRYQETMRIPNIIDLYSSISQTSETSRRKSDYHDSVENRIHTLVSIFGNVLNVEVGIPLEELCKKPCVIELAGLRPAEQNWLVEVILSWIYFYHLYQDQRGEELRQVIFVDECHRIFDKSKEYRQTAIEMGTPIISIFPSQFRDFGLSLVLASQQPSQVMNSVHSNTLTKIVGNLSSGIDIAAIAEALGLDDELTDCIHKLKRAQWIVRMSDGHTEPFLIETPDYPVEKNVTDDEVLERLQSVFSEYLPKDEPEKQEKPKLKVILPQLSDDTWTLLFDINKHPFRGSLKGLSTRYTALNFSSSKGNSAKNELIKKRLVEEVPVRLTGRPMKFHVLTDYAINVLRNMGHDTRLWVHTGNMSFIHQLYIVIIRYTFLRAGYKAYAEKKLKNGRRVDVLVILDDKKIAIEVELQKVDLQSKLRALEEVDELIILVDKKTILQPMNELPQPVKIYEITEYLRWLKSNYYSNIKGKNYNNRKKSKSPSKK